MEEIRSLESISFEDLFAAFNEAFKDYERNWTKDELNSMLQRRGYNASLSFGAFDQGKLVSFTLNGTGVFNGLPTAYDTGTGTIKEYRAGGLATKIFEASLPHLKQAGFSRYLLEVLQNNAKAISIYTQLGFKINRELNYFIQDVKEINFRSTKTIDGYALKETSLQENTMAELWDFLPAWQNSFAAINRQAGNFRIIGAFYNNSLAGYGIIEPSSGDIPQLAVQAAHRRKGLATALLKALIQHSYSPSVKCINTDAGCTAMTEVFASCNLTLRGKQFEMIKDIE